MKPQLGANVFEPGQENYDGARQMIVGVPALGIDKAYMVPYDADNMTMFTVDMDIPEDSELLHVNWRTHFHG